MEVENVTIKSEYTDEDDCIIEEEIHIKEEDTQIWNDTPYKCGICGHRTTSNTLLKVHMKIHLKKRAHPCTMCNETFNLVSELNSHILTHTKEKCNFQCEVCTRDCFTEADLHKHYRVHTKEKPVKCKLCFRAFSDDAYLRIHIRSQHGEDHLASSMKKDGTYVDPSLVQNVNENKPEDFQCEVCGKHFSHKEFLNLHLESHLEQQLHHGVFGINESITGNIAPTEVSDNYIENCRMTITVNVLNIECKYSNKTGTVCAKTFSNRKAYEEHIKSHEIINGKQLDSDEDTTTIDTVKCKEKTVFKCTLCSRHFPVPSKLKSHMRTHTGEKPFKCETCGKSFATAGSLKDHGYIHTSDRPFKCTSCEKGYTKKRALGDITDYFNRICEIFSNLVVSLSKGYWTIFRMG